MKRKRINLIFFLIIFLYTSLLLSNYLTGHYGGDTYNIINIGYINYAINWSLKDGRIFMFLFGVIMHYTHASIDFYVIFTLIVSIVISCVSVIKLKNIIESYKKTTSIFEEFIILIISYITIFNFMYIECFYFVECIVISLSILLIIISAEKFVAGGKKNILLSFIILLFSVFLYQGTICFYITLVTLLLIIKQNNLKRISIDIFKCLIIFASAILLNILFVKLICFVFNLHQQRWGSIEYIFNNIIFIIKNIPNVIYRCNNLFPRNLFVIYLVIIIYIETIYVLIFDRKSKDKLLLILFYIMFTIVVSFIINLTSLTSFYTGRIRFPLGSLIGCVFIYLFVLNLFKTKSIKYIMLFILLSYFIINSINYYNIISDSKKTNFYEKNEVKQINNYIIRCEKLNNIRIKKISYIYVPDKIEYNDLCGHDINNKNGLTIISLKLGWGATGTINFYSDRKLKDQGTVIISKKFLKKNEKYKCVGDTLYLRIFDFGPEKKVIMN